MFFFDVEIPKPESDETAGLVEAAWVILELLRAQDQAHVCNRLPGTPQHDQMLSVARVEFAEQGWHVSKSDLADAIAWAEAMRAEELRAQT